MDIYELRGKIIWLSLIGLQSFYTSYWAEALVNAKQAQKFSIF